jgi:hypothetical protein
MSLKRKNFAASKKKKKTSKGDIQKDFSDSIKDFDDVKLNKLQIDLEGTIPKRLVKEKKKSKITVKKKK